MKRAGLAIILSSLFIGASAQAQMNMSGAFTSNASQFAMQAGIIGGTAQACGENLAVYNSHVAEAVNVLSRTPLERVQAMAAYQKTFTEAHTYQKSHNTMNCAQVVQTFNNLPLLRPDYKQTVLPQLAQLNNISSGNFARPIAVPNPKSISSIPQPNNISTNVGVGR